MRYRVEFGWDSQREIYAGFEAETIADAERIAMHLLDRIRITRVVRVHPLDEGLAKSTNLPRAVITDIEEKWITRGGHAPNQSRSQNRRRGRIEQRPAERGSVAVGSPCTAVTGTPPPTRRGFQTRSVRCRLLAGVPLVRLL
jgi:hypothetical protein